MVFSQAASIQKPRLERHFLYAADVWLASEATLSKRKIQENITAPGTVPGVVIASPQRANPDYFRHWVRDAGLVMKVVVKLATRAGTEAEKRFWEARLVDYVVFSRQNQMSRTLVGLGEPIFEVNGAPFLGPWGRPQNDGPALRAVALIEWAHALLDRGQESNVRDWLYDSRLPAQTVIKADLEYVSNHWRDSNFDLWEEVKGDHFFTRMAQRKALADGAVLAERLNDPAAAAWYRLQTSLLDQELAKHWNGQFITATLNRTEGADYKHSGLDMAVLLGVLRAPHPDYDVQNPQVQKTFVKLVQQFSQFYSINTRFPELAPALGRYTEDRYGGTHFDGGNPWVLTTLAAAEICYQLSAHSSSVAVAQAWIQKGDAFVQRTQFHAYGNGSLSEQMDRESGYMTSAADLTWNYAAILTTSWARELSLQNINLIKSKNNKRGN